jgi:hypothetical protein
VDLAGRHVVPPEGDLATVQVQGAYDVHGASSSS